VDSGEKYIGKKTCGGKRGVTGKGKEGKSTDTGILAARLKRLPPE